MNWFAWGQTPILAAVLVAAGPPTARAEDGYDLWLRYWEVEDATRLAEYRAAVGRLVVQGGSPTLIAARDELVAGLTGLLGRPITATSSLTSSGTLIVGTPASSPLIASLPLAAGSP